MGMSNEHTCHANCPCQTGGDPMPDFVEGAVLLCEQCGQPFVNNDKMRDVGEDSANVIIHECCREAYMERIARSTPPATEVDPGPERGQGPAEPFVAT